MKNETHVRSGEFLTDTKAMDKTLGRQRWLLWKHRLGVIAREINSSMGVGGWFAVWATIWTAVCGYLGGWDNPVNDRVRYSGTRSIMSTAQTFQWEYAIGGCFIGMFFAILSFGALALGVSAWDAFRQGPLARIRQEWTPNDLHERIQRTRNER